MIFTIVPTEDKDLLGGQIARRDVLKLVSHFRDHQYFRMRKSQKTTCAFFSIEEIQNFLDKEKRAGADGLRIYFGAVPEEFEPVNEEYVDRMTVVLVTTKKSDDNKYDEELLADGNQVLIPFGETEKNTAGEGAYDFATLCPPDCGRIHTDAVNTGISVKDDVYNHKVQV